MNRPRQERLVVVGHGMASARLVERLVERGYAGRVTVLGDEPVPAYNRILLSALLEGTQSADGLSLREPGWYADHGVELRLGTRVLGIDRARAEVLLADGTCLPWDRLVLATGANPTLPPIRGIVRPDGRWHPSVHAFRSLADCRRLLDALPDAPPDAASGGPRLHRAVVVGGGLLGLQVARALGVRGVATEVVEGGSHVLSGQVDERGGDALVRSLRALGTEVYTGARAVRLTDDGLRLDNGYVLDTDLVVLTAGARPATGLARAAGLAVRRGVVVDDRLASVSDPRIHAIGDCAEHDGRTTGFVGPAWEQARVLGELLAGRSAAYTRARTVARLRATDLDVALLGDPLREVGQVVEMTNPVAGSHRRLVVRDGVLVAAALVGDLARLGLLTQHYDRGTVLGPHEPAALLLPERGAEPAPLPDEAEVCACAGVSAGRLRACRSLAEARETTRATTGCGGCLVTVAALVGAGGGTAGEQAFSPALHDENPGTTWAS